MTFDARRTNRDRRDQAFARSVIAQAERRRRAGEPQGDPLMAEAYEVIMFDYQDPGTDPAYCDGLDATKTERCETCGDDVDACDATYNSNGKYAFCSEACWQEYLCSLED